MKSLRLSATAGLFLAALTVAFAQTPAPSPAPAPAAAPAAAAVDDPTDALTPAPRPGFEKFARLHESFLQRAKEGPVGLLFIGDSITEGWKNAPHIWEHCFGKYQPANFGIGGDRTQHVLWRIDNGELDGISPKVVVLMIGTNNSGGDSAGEIIAANRKIVAGIREKLPETKILLLGIFPRGLRPNRDGTPDNWEQRMERIRAINADMATLDDGSSIRYLDIGAHFLGNDGTIPKSIMPDQLHLSPAGYQLWADAIRKTIDEMML